jgi:hypothetical protein
MSSSRWGVKRPTYQKQELNDTLIAKATNVLEKDRIAKMLNQVRYLEEAQRIATINVGDTPLQRYGFKNFTNQQQEEKKMQIEQNFTNLFAQNKMMVDQKVAAITPSIEQMIEMRKRQKYIEPVETPMIRVPQEETQQTINQNARRYFAIETLNHNRY